MPFYRKGEPKRQQINEGINECSNYKKIFFLENRRRRKSLTKDVLIDHELFLRQLLPQDISQPSSESLRASKKFDQCRVSVKKLLTE